MRKSLVVLADLKCWQSKKDSASSSFGQVDKILKSSSFGKISKDGQGLGVFAMSTKTSSLGV